MADCILYGSSSVIADYITNGLVYYEDGKANNNAVISSDYSPLITLSSVGLTVELRYRANSAAQNSFCGMHIGSNAPYIVVNFSKETASLGENSDYCLLPFVQYGSSSFTEDIISLDNLKFGDIHTYTVLMNNGTLECYFDGVKTNLSHSGLNYSFAVNKVALMRRIDRNDRNTVGKWYNARVYNRALTESEIAANYAIDVSKYNS